MTFRSFITASGMLLVLACGSLNAQSAQLVYTQAGLSQALAIKNSLDGWKVEVWPAGSLINASAERQSAYIAKLTGVDVVVVIGEDAMKATAAIAFPIPLVVVNATGEAAGKAAIVRVLDASFSGAAPAGAKDISGGDGASGATKASRNLVFKCQGITAGAAVKKLATELR